MSTAQIKFATDILRRLGEELNPSPVQGILELVRNSYDANARNCKVELLNTHQPCGTIIVSDDGDGMDAEDIASGWLVLGRSNKSAKSRTRLGRRPSGSKGLGRLAALRSGTQATLTTRPRSSKTSAYRLVINWADYKEVDLVDQVPLTIERTERRQGEEDGTEVTLEDVEVRLSSRDVRRLARSLILLADPFKDDREGFKPELVAPEFKDLEKLVKNRYFQDAEYHLIAKVDYEGVASAFLVDWRGEELFAASHEELTVRRDHRPYSCPPATFDLWVFLLNSIAFSTRQSTLGEVRSWLREFGGVHLYDNGLRVAPYGDPNNDWLGINLRRAQSPEERPSTNTVIGRVSVEDTEGFLIQKTDRSGFIEGEPFIELRNFAQDALEWLAARRMEVAEQRRARERTEASRRSSRSKRDLEQVIESAPPESRKQLRQAYNTYNQSRDKEVGKLRREVQLYRTLSTAGIAAATFAHESDGNPIKVIVQSIKSVERRARRTLDGQYETTLKEPVDSIIKSIKALAVLSGVTLSLVDHEKRRVSRVEVHPIITGVLDTYRPFLSNREVEVKLDLHPGAPYLQGTEAALESIITNLLNNSLAAFERSPSSERVVVIETAVEEDVLTLRVFDSGPGIQDISIRDIWLPGESTTTNGTGLGLTIVRDAVSDLGGRVRAVEHCELGGAEFIITLPILGV